MTENLIQKVDRIILNNFGKQYIKDKNTRESVIGLLNINSDFFEEVQE